MITYVRHVGACAPHAFEPKRPDHPSCGRPCPACDKPLGAGQRTALVALGPADDWDERRKCGQGLRYLAVAVEVHSACAGLDVDAGGSPT